MGSKGLQQFKWKVLSLKISISNGLQQCQKLLESKTLPRKDIYGFRLCYKNFHDVLFPTPLDSTIRKLLIYLLFSALSVDIPSTMESNVLQWSGRNGLYHMSCCRFHLSIGLECKTLLKMGSNGLQQIRRTSWGWAGPSSALAGA